MTTKPFNRTIAVIDQRPRSLPVPVAPVSGALDGQSTDTLGRPLRDLRISVTDRCNFRCSYCMPKEVFDKDYAYLPQQSLLSFEEITRIARQFISLGVQKIRLTGGEPLLRKNIEVLVAQLSQLRTLDGTPLDITLTTNGSLLARKAQALKDAGLQRVTVSLDGLDDAIFKKMNDVDFPVSDVLRGIAAAQAAGLGPIKVNMVAKHFRGSGIALRFIEYMDVGATNGWRMDEVMPSADVIALLQTAFPLVALEAAAPGETAQRWGYADAQGRHDTQAGEIGVISSVTQAFCADCNRARLSTEGQLYLCLFATQGYDLRALVRSPKPDGELLEAIARIWQGRSDRYSLLRAALPVQAADGENTPRRVEMSYIGG